MSSIARFRPLLAVVIFLTAAATAFAQGSAFTYQGKLTDGGSAPTGAYDFRLILYNADAGGSQVGTTLTADDVAVTAGAFTVVLDFGPNIFDGQARWLELAVRQGASTGIYTVLSPRQPVTPAPYAIFAAKAGSVANGGITAAQLAPGAVTGTAIASGAITADKIPDGAISTNKLSPSVLAGLGGAPSGAVLMSQDPNATNLTAAGYLRVGSELNPNEFEVLQPTGSYLPNQQSKAAWTGSDLLVWGGNYNNVVNRFRFNLATNQWTPMAISGEPEGRYDHSTLWTGSEMLIWGGQSNSPSTYFSVASGGRYNPASDSWLPISNVNAPQSRCGHSAIWTGTEMIVWGGETIENGNRIALATGARYNPAANAWTPISAIGAPTARARPFAFWTGTRMLVWGSSNGGDTTGGLYNPATDTWTPMSASGAPSSGSVVAWTGSELAAEDSSNAGLKCYTPATDTWRALPKPPAAAGVSRVLVWTGTALLYFSATSVQTLVWDTQQWTVRPNSAVGGFYGFRVFWVGNSALLFNASLNNPLARYRPQSPLYLYMKP